MILPKNWKKSAGNGNIKKICLDTSLFIYYFEAHPEFGPLSKVYFEDLLANKLAAVTTIISLTELLSFTKLILLPKQIIRDFFNIPNLKVIEVNQEIAITAAEIRREYHFKLADSIQLATAVFAKADAFLTNDARLKPFKKLKVIIL